MPKSSRIFSANSSSHFLCNSQTSSNGLLKDFSFSTDTAEKESDKLGYKLSAICGVNWLVGQLFRWQSLVFEMIACAILIKKISAILEISSNCIERELDIFDWKKMIYYSY